MRFLFCQRKKRNILKISSDGEEKSGDSDKLKNQGTEKIVPLNKARDIRKNWLRKGFSKSSLTVEMVRKGTRKKPMLEFHSVRFWNKV
jgi:hypothetical protein